MLTFGWLIRDPLRGENNRMSDFTTWMKPEEEDEDDEEDDEGED